MFDASALGASLTTALGLRLGLAPYSGYLLGCRKECRMAQLTADWTDLLMVCSREHSLVRDLAQQKVLR